MWGAFFKHIKNILQPHIQNRFRCLVFFSSYIDDQKLSVKRIDECFYGSVRRVVFQISDYRQGERHVFYFCKPGI